MSFTPRPRVGELQPELNVIVALLWLELAPPLKFLQLRSPPQLVMLRHCRRLKPIGFHAAL
jgi:hypothetical protein